MLGHFYLEGLNGVWKELRLAANLEMSLSFSTNPAGPQPLE